jgi:hypothetical protein
MSSKIEQVLLETTPLNLDVIKIITSYAYPSLEQREKGARMNHKKVFNEKVSNTVVYNFFIEKYFKLKSDELIQGYKQFKNVPIRQCTLKLELDGLGVSCDVFLLKENGRVSIVPEYGAYSMKKLNEFVIIKDSFINYHLHRHILHRLRTVYGD